MSQLRQEPAQIRSAAKAAYRKKSVNSKIRPPLQLRRAAAEPKSGAKITLFDNAKKENSRIKYTSNAVLRDIDTRIERGEKHREKSRGISFSIPSFATLAVTAGTVIIALAALNWEDFNFNTPETYAFNPAEDASAGQITTGYASTGITGIIGATNYDTLQNLGLKNENALTAQQIAAKTEDDNPHGVLLNFEWQQYKVKRGDTVSEIAENYSVSVGAIIASNEISNARMLQAGTVIRIPNIDGIPYQIQTGDSLSKISASFNVPLDVILDVNDIKNDNIRQGETIFIPGARMNDIDLRMSLGDLFMYPLATRYITSYYGMRKDPFTGVLQFHGGVDFRANTGTAIMASFDGLVSVVSENWLYGKYIIISHSNGYKTIYGHLSAYSVKQGDRVIRGRKIGEVGNTGYSTGPHLHFGIYDKNNKLVNPLELLN